MGETLWQHLLLLLRKISDLETSVVVVSMAAVSKLGMTPVFLM